MSVIQVLDKHVAELIAAGEVVERPASVIKELVENTIDAGARHVTVEIRNGGVSYMRITDDGCGMAREDVPTAFLRHATSKVRSEEDLYDIHTLGFRGEALASVAAVARVDLTTCLRGEMVGTHYVIHGGEEIISEDAGCPEGSTFIIEDLFYNIPARMKFLKKDVSEGNAVAGVVERLALSHPEVSVRFIRDGHTDLQTAGDGDLFSCIHAVFGKPFATGLIPVNYGMGGITVSGYICKPEACRQNRSMQHFFVNGRYVKTQTALVALERAYKGVMMVGRFPTCVLKIDMPAETVDANVHPAKIEVRFINEKPVFDAVYYAAKSALESGDTIHRVLLAEEETRRPAPPPPVPERRPLTPVKIQPTEKRPVEHSSMSFLDVSVDDDLPTDISLRDGTLSHPTVAPKLKPVAPPAPAPVEEKPVPVQQLVMEEEKPVVRLIGEVFLTYILAELNGNLYIIDKHAAHERILYNALKANERSDAQVLLAPVHVTVSQEEHTALIENADVLQQAGIEIEDFGGNCILVRSFPMILSGVPIDATVQEIAAGLSSGSHEVVSEKLDWIYHSSACRAATKAGDTSQPAEMLHLAEQVLLKDDIRYCPHGRPVCVELTKKELEKMFGRIQ